MYSLKKFAVAAATAGALSVAVPAAAQATITPDQCRAMLRGQSVTWAPDNDVKRWWDWLEATYRVDVTSSSDAVWTYYNANDIGTTWRFYGNYGGYYELRFLCWTDGFIDSGARHDDRY